ncbi:MAG: 8-oxoguanine deaminase [SAR324 cluster bacterium]|nr:8-oxoguanine deaminase [SAR324 cluster bacterium]MBL7034451.1 8-oxoguanine deaminase [SAR324 cluster bacterium]
MKIWLKNPLSILAENAGGGILVEGNCIIELVPSGRQPSAEYDSVVDASQHVVLPGLINLHHHFYQTLTRVYPQALNKELFPWLKTLYPLWAGLTPEALRVGTRLALAELLLSGCTTASDHHYVFPSGLENAIDFQIDEAKNLGIRVVLCRGSMDCSEKDGGLPPDSVVQTCDEILADSERLIQQYHNSEEGAMTQIALAPCSPFSVSETVMRESAKLAKTHQVLLHTHLAETEDENSFCLETIGSRPLDYLEQVGWLDNQTWLAHGIHFTDEEIQKLAAAKTGISHCPSSNMVLSSGICRVPDLEKAGVEVGLGVDGSASNDSSNLMQEVRQAFLLQRLQSGSQVTHIDALRWATSGGANVLGRAELGRIAVGMQADLALFKLDELRFSGYGDPLAALVICGAHQADSVMVAGKWIVEDGQIPGLDLKQLKLDHHREAKRLQQK